MPMRPIGSEVIAGRENAVAEIGLGDRAQAGDGAARRERCRLVSAS